MPQNAELRCRCGNVSGEVLNAAPNTVNRVVCYCADCQAFAHHIGRADLLDEHGGSNLVQVAPAALRFSRGTEHIVGLRLSEKGLYRYYTRCCQTPVGNTARPSIPFVGILAPAFVDGPNGHGADGYFGAKGAGIFGKDAVGTPPAGSDKLNLRLMARTVGKVLGWRLRGQVWPHPFFDRVTGSSVYPLTTLSREQREALRPLCGPRPSAAV